MNTLNHSTTDWQKIYDRFSSSIYGLVIRLIPDEKIAEEILLEVFVSLKKNCLIDQEDQLMCHVILKHTYDITRSELKKRDIIPQIASVETDEIMSVLCNIRKDYNQAPADLKEKIIERKKLREKLMHFRKQKTDMLTETKVPEYIKNFLPPLFTEPALQINQ